MTVRFLHSVVVAGTSYAVGDEATLAAGLEANLVESGMAENITTAPVAARPRFIAQLFGKKRTNDELREVETTDDGALHVQVQGVAAADLDHQDDDVLVYGGQDGATTTHRVVNTDASGRLRTNVQDGQDANAGATTDAAVEGDTSGTMSAKLRGLQKATGATGDAAPVAGATGTLSGKLRALSRDVGATDDAAATAGGTGTLAAKTRALSRDVGATDDAAIEGDTAGTLSGKLRGANKALGTTADADATGNGSLIGILKRLRTILTDVWDDTANAVRVTQETHDELNLNANVQVANTDVSVTNPVPVEGTAGDGATATENPLRMAGTDASSVLRTVRTSTTGNAEVAGDTAHDSPDGGKPVKFGARAVAHGTNPTPVDAADRVDLLANRHGIPWVIGGHPHVTTTEYRWDTAQTNDDVLGAVATGEKLVITQIMLTLDEATTVGVQARVGFGTASVPAEPADGASVNGIILSHSGVVPGGGVVRGDGSGILGVGADGEELRITAQVPTSGSGRLTVSWYKVPS